MKPWCLLWLWVKRVHKVVIVHDGFNVSSSRYIVQLLLFCFWELLWVEILQSIFFGNALCTEYAQYHDLCVGLDQVGRREIRCHRRLCDSRPQHLWRRLPSGVGTREQLGLFYLSTSELAVTWSQPLEILFYVFLHSVYRLPSFSRVWAFFFTPGRMLYRRNIGQDKNDDVSSTLSVTFILVQSSQDHQDTGSMI